VADVGVIMLEKEYSMNKYKFKSLFDEDERKAIGAMLRHHDSAA